MKLKNPMLVVTDIDKSVEFYKKDFTKEYLDNIRYYCLVMSENYIRNHFSDIKNFANIIEKRLDDEYCTLENMLKDNAQILKIAQKYNVNYVLIDEEYKIDIDFL